MQVSGGDLLAAGLDGGDTLMFRVRSGSFPSGKRFSFLLPDELEKINAGVRWTPAATSSKTGGIHNVSSPFGVAASAEPFGVALSVRS